MTTSAWYPDTGSVSVLPTELWSISEPAKHLDRALLSLLFQPTYEACLNLVTVASWHSVLLLMLYQERYKAVMKSFLNHHKITFLQMSNWTIKQSIDNASMVSIDSGLVSVYQVSYEAQLNPPGIQTLLSYQCSTTELWSKIERCNRGMLAFRHCQCCTKWAM